MKVAVVSRRYPPLIGGAERVLGYLAPALGRAGVDVTVLTSRLDDSPRSEVSDGPSRVERLATSSVRFVGTLAYLRNLGRWFDRNPVDLAYVSMLKHDAYAVLRASRRHNFPVVLRPEGAGLTGDVAWQKWGRFGRTIARACRAADALVAISPAVRRELEGEGYDRSTIFDLPNGVPVPAEPWSRPEPFGRPLRAVAVGRLSPEKGHDLLVEGWPAVDAAIPGARLAIVGEGPARPRLERRIADLGLAGKVELLGALADPLAEVRRSDLFVLPSREEGMSVALLEAMALGIPVTATDISGNRALLHPGFGRLAPPDDPAALARSIVDHHRDPSAEGQARAARRRVEAGFSIDAVAARHVELFRRVIDDRKGRLQPRSSRQ